MKRLLILLSLVAGLGMSCSMGVALFPDVSQYENHVANISITTNFVSSGRLANYINLKFFYKLDSEQFGVTEYWQTPEEAWVNNNGDCEDFAILFMAFLKLNSFDIANYRMISTTGHAGVLEVSSSVTYSFGNGITTCSFRSFEAMYGDVLYQYTYAETMFQAYEHQRMY